MAKTENYDTRHDREVASLERRIADIYKTAVREAARIGVTVHDVNPGRIFSFDDYPLTRKKADKLLKELRDSVEAAIVNAVRSQWTLANDKNDELSRRVFGENVGKLPQSAYRRYFSNNEKAREAFLKRKENGLDLSEKVWKYAGQFREEIEMGLDIGIRSGQSALDMARSLQRYLQRPDELFRRVRDTHGQLRLSQRAKAYHPGRGVYRSSFRNARRLAATETNIAYRTADYLRWQQLDFVVGVRVVLSRNHTLNGKPFRDMCDDLSAPAGSTAISGRGCYPKDFKFTGWHPLCRCHSESILKTEKEMEADTKRILSGEEPSKESVNTVRDVPGEFTKWVRDNQKRIEGAKSLPYFIRDNFRDGNPAKGYVWQDYVYRVGEGRVEVHHLVNPKDSDYKKLIQIAEYFASRGSKVEVAPKMTRPPKFEYEDVYGSLVGTKYEGKCPDLRIDGHWYEHEGYVTNNPKRALKNMLNDGLKQSDRLIIDRPDLTENYIIHNIIVRNAQGQGITEVWLRGKDELKLIYKKRENP